jgi:hypothetical protein
LKNKSNQNISNNEDQKNSTSVVIKEVEEKGKTLAAVSVSNEPSQSIISSKEVTSDLKNSLIK